MAETLAGPLATPLVGKLVVIGMGLIGASICRVARQQNLAGTIVGCDADSSVRDRATAISLVDEPMPISCPAIPWPAPSIPGRTLASPRFS